MADGKNAGGFVFTIDATLALFLMILSLITVVFLSSQAEYDPWGNLQTVRAGKDALAAMDRTGVLTQGNRTQIEETLNRTLPASLSAHLQIATYYYDNGTFNLINITEYGAGVPGNATTWGARRDFVSMKNRQVTNYSIVRMTVWQD